MSTVRDTHFAGFAKLLFDKLNNNACITLADHPDFDRMVELQKELEILTQQIIAKCAYDLVKHTIESTSHHDLDVLSSDEHVERIPDLNEWTKEEA